MNCRLFLFPAIFSAGILFSPIDSSAQAAFHVRAGATGSNNGTDWNNSFTTLPASLQRNAIYYVADGSYGSYFFDTAESGAQLVTIKKATSADHGSGTGWNSGYGDGQAVFSSFTLAADYLVIDGQTRNEGDWDNGAAYGFRISDGVAANTAWTSNVCASNITVRYADIGGPDIGNTLTGNESSAGFYIGGFDESCTNWTLQRNYVHNTGLHGAAFHMNGTNTGLIEYNWISNSWGKEAIRGQIRMSNYVIRYNVMKDSCQATGTAGEGCTAEIAIWDGSAGAFDGNKIYGNIFQKTTNESNNGGVIVVGGNGGSWVGSPASNTEIYNNTVVGILSSQAGITINGGAGNICRNNLWYNSAGTPACAANTSSNNQEVSADPFVGLPSGNLRLAAPTAAGVSLLSPFNIDPDGVTRGSAGVWDLGAYEYTGAVSPTPTPSATPAPTPTPAVPWPPTNLRVN